MHRKAQAKTQKGRGRTAQAKAEKGGGKGKGKCKGKDTERQRQQQITQKGRGKGTERHRESKGQTQVPPSFTESYLQDYRESYVKFQRAADEDIEEELQSLPDTVDDNEEDEDQEAAGGGKMSYFQAVGGGKMSYTEWRQQGWEVEHQIFSSEEDEDEEHQREEDVQSQPDMLEDEEEDEDEEQGEEEDSWEDYLHHMRETHLKMRTTRKLDPVYEAKKEVVEVVQGRRFRVIKRRRKPGGVWAENQEDSEEEGSGG